MIRHENHCCDCAVPSYPCLGSSCPYINVPVYYCDICDNDTYANYEIDEKYYCEKHIKEYINENFNELSLSEQAEILNIKLKE